jgi:hypothetical protein
MLRKGKTGPVLVLTLAAVLNLPSLYSVFCFSLCESGICSQQATRKSADHCPEHSGLPHSEHSSDRSCAKHGHSSLAFLVSDKLEASIDFGSHGTGLIAFPVISLPDSTFVKIRPQPAHGPPGSISGREVCQKKSLLRI